MKMAATGQTNVIYTFCQLKDIWQNVVFRCQVQFQLEMKWFGPKYHGKWQKIIKLFSENYFYMSFEQNLSKKMLFIPKSLINSSPETSSRTSGVEPKGVNSGMTELGPALKNWLTKEIASQNAVAKGVGLINDESSRGTKALMIRVVSLDEWGVQHTCDTDHLWSFQAG